MSIFGDNPLGHESAPATTDTTNAAVSAPDAQAPPAPPVEQPVETPPVVPAPEGAAPEPKYFNPDDFKDHLVKLKVGGEDVELSLSEAFSSAMRGQDYTRKTQELAEAKRRLHQADALTASLERDPERTLRQLAEAYDLDSSGLQPVQREPDEQRLIDMQRSLARQEAELQQRRIQNEIQALTQEYGDFDVPAVAQYAYQTGTDLSTAYKAMNYELLRQGQQEQVRQEAAREAARAAQVVHSGATTSRGVAENPAKVDNIRDAWKLAEQQLKLT